MRVQHELRGCFVECFWIKDYSIIYGNGISSNLGKTDARLGVSVNCCIFTSISEVLGVPKKLGKNGRTNGPDRLK